MIWEVDDDLDGMINNDEFVTMYKRCTKLDENGLEPRKFFNLVEFLMYDKEFKGSVTVEDTLLIIFVRHRRGKLDEEIRAIFGEEEKNEDGQEKMISYAEYIEKVEARALRE